MPDQAAALTPGTAVKNLAAVVSPSKPVGGEKRRVQGQGTLACCAGVFHSLLAALPLEDATARRPTSAPLPGLASARAWSEKTGM
eukprot:14318597-Alexandrium_andersonii.AAC.1